MNQALHIFRKDVRRLWPWIAVSLALTAGQAVLNISAVTDQRPLVSDPSFAQMIAMTGWWFLMAAAVHGESLVGDRAFWLTRPYRRGSLIAAKVLVAVAFVQIPMLVADVVTLNAVGFSAGAVIPGLLWRQLLIACWLAFGIALAAITRDIAQLVIAGLASVALLLLLVNNFPWANFSPYAMGWGRNVLFGVLVTVAALLVCWWQYTRRGLWAGRGLLYGGLALSLFAGLALPWRSLIAMQLAVTPATTAFDRLSIRFDPTRQASEFTPGRKGHLVQFAIPLHIEGYDEKLFPDAHFVHVTLRDRFGKESVALSSELHGRSQWLTFFLRDQRVRMLAAEPVRLHAALVLNASRHVRDVVIPQDGDGHAVGDAHCRAMPLDGGIQVRCLYPMRQHEDLELEPGATSRGQMSFSPLPGELSATPIVTGAGWCPRNDSAPVRITVLEPIAHCLREFDADLPRLGDYAAR